MLLVDNDKSDIFKGRENCRASADNEIDLPSLYASVSIKALPLRKRGVYDGNALAVPTAEDIDRLRCQEINTNRVEKMITCMNMLV